jgi:hypothetical protein
MEHGKDITIPKGACVVPELSVPGGEALILPSERPQKFRALFGYPLLVRTSRDLFSNAELNFTDLMVDQTL